MLSDFKRIDPERVPDNLIGLIRGGMLVTCGTPDKFNTMTANWGGMGFLWNKPVCFVFIRPSRYTFGFAEENAAMSLSFFTDEYKDVLTFCGAKSGRDVDKVSACKLTPLELPGKCVAFNEARLVLECRKLCAADFEPGQFIDNSINMFYKDNNYHRMYICEITGVYTK